MTFLSDMMRAFALAPGPALTLSNLLNERQGLVLVCSPAGCGAEELFSALLSEVSLQRPGRIKSAPGDAGEGDVVFVEHFRTCEMATECTAAARRTLVVAPLASGERQGALLRLCDMLGDVPDEALPTVYVVTTRLLNPTPLDSARSVTTTAELLRGSELEPYASRLAGSPVYWSDGEHSHPPKRGSILVVGIGRALAPWGRDEIRWELLASLVDDALVKVAAGLVTLNEAMCSVPVDFHYP